MHFNMGESDQFTIIFNNHCYLQDVAGHDFNRIVTIQSIFLYKNIKSRIK